MYFILRSLIRGGLKPTGSLTGSAFGSLVAGMWLGVHNLRAVLLQQWVQQHRSRKEGNRLQGGGAAERQEQQEGCFAGAVAAVIGD